MTSDYPAWRSITGDAFSPDSPKEVGQPVASVWIELSPDLGWGDTRVAIGDIERLGYRTEEIRGTHHMLRLSGSRLDSKALWRMPGKGRFERGTLPA